MGRSKDAQTNSHTQSPHLGAAHPGAVARPCLCCQQNPACPQARGPIASCPPYVLCSHFYPPPSLHPSLRQASSSQPRTLHRSAFILSCQPPPPSPFFFVNKFFQNGKKNPSPFPVPPCHVPKVPTNLRCPACTQPPLIAPAFSSGVSSAIATAAPPPPGNSHLHYHSLLQSRPQAPGSEQQLR